MNEKIKYILLSNKYFADILVYLNKQTLNRYVKWKRNRNFLKNGQKALFQLDKAMKSKNINYWIDFGTLLGAIRENSFIAHDYDIDIGMYLDEYSIDIESTLIRNGFKKKYEHVLQEDGIDARLDTYEYLNIEIDIFFYTKIDNKKAFFFDFISIPGKGRVQTIQKIGGLIPRQITLSLEYIGAIEFLGQKFPIPMPVDKHLRDRYGEGYMIKDLNWHYSNKTTNTNVAILENKIATIKKYKV